MIDEAVVAEIIENFAGLEPVTVAISSASNLVSLVAYALTAYSFYTIAQRRGIKSAWLAWVPVVQLWVVGAIADDYQLKAKKKASKKRVILLCLLLVKIVVGLLLFIMFVGAILAVLSAGYQNYNDWTDWAGVIGSFGGLLLVFALLWILAIAQKIVEYFALYDVYCSCDSGNALLFVLLNVFIAITKPIFLLIVHKKDDGMPAIADPWEHP